MRFYNRDNEINELTCITSALIAEVKRNVRSYDGKSFMSKVEHIKNKILSGYEIESRLYTMDDM